MKQAFCILVMLCTTPVASLAQRGILLGWPHDDPNVRREVYFQAQLKPFISEYDHCIASLIRAFRDKDITDVLGPRLERGKLMVQQDPTNSAAPVFAPPSLSFSGLQNIGDKSHQDLYAVDNLGYVRFFYDLDGGLNRCALYLPLDETFIPLRSTNDFSKRLEWDRGRFDSIKKWLDTHLNMTGEPDAAPEPPPAAAVLESSENMKLNPKSEAPTASGGR